MLSQLKKLGKLLPVIVLSAVHFAASAQKVEKPVIDKFTNDTTYFTTTEKVAATNGSMSQSVENIEAYASKKKSAIFGHFNLIVTVADHKCFHVSNGSQILLKLSDNSIVSLSCIDDKESKRISYGSHFLKTLNWACWSADIPFKLTNEDIQKINASLVVGIRIQTNEQNYDLDIKPKDAATLTKMFQLIVAAK